MPTKSVTTRQVHCCQDESEEQTLVRMYGFSICTRQSHDMYPSGYTILIVMAGSSLRAKLLPKHSPVQTQYCPNTVLSSVLPKLSAAQTHCCPNTAIHTVCCPNTAAQTLLPNQIASQIAAQTFIVDWQKRVLHCQ